MGADISAPPNPASKRPAATTGRVVAVMQPYFYPYAGYLRLLAAADVFVILDDVQFNRRGRVHRSQLPGAPGYWLTLPLARQPREVRIKDLAFASDARARLDAQLDRLPWLSAGRGPLAERVREQLRAPVSTPAAVLDASLALLADALELPARRMRSSSLGLAPELRGQDRIIAIAKAIDAETYVNSPGGRELYAPSAFTDAGLRLRFLTPYGGCFPYLLPALMTETADTIRRDIMDQTALTT